MGVIPPEEGWTVSIGPVALAPTLSLLHVTLGDGGVYTVSWMAVAEEHVALRELLVTELEQLEAFASALPDPSALKVSFRLYIFADGDLQSNFVDREPEAGGATMAQLISEGRRRLPASPTVDASVSRQQP